MNTNLAIEKKIETALSSIDNIAPAEPPAFFTGKVLNKLNTQHPAAIDKWVAWLINPRVAFAALIIILIMNVLVVVYNLDTSKSPDPNYTAVTEVYAQSSSNSFYLETIKP